MRYESVPYYDVIKAFEHRTGYGVIVNTSFNIRGEPIVCTPYDAHRCFMRTEMDVLVLGNQILLKEEQPDSSERKGHIEDEEPPPPPPPDPERIAALTDLLEQQLIPIAAGLQSAKSIAIDPSRRGDESTWHDVQWGRTADSVHRIPSPLTSAASTPAERAAAMTGFWAPGRATDELRPFVEALLALARAEVSDEETRGQRVSQSVYVMY